MRGWNHAQILNELRSLGTGYMPSIGGNDTALIGAGVSEQALVAGTAVAVGSVVYSQNAKGDGGSSSNDSGSSSGGTNNTNEDPFEGIKDSGRFKENYNNIKNGKGTPRIDEATGQQKIFRRKPPADAKNPNPKWYDSWKGAKEWDVPNSPNNEWRMLEQKLPNGGTRWAITKDHYRTIQEVKNLYEKALK